MWIVALALRRPYTFVVAALLTIILGVVVVERIAVDIFPVIDIPVVSVIWTFNGMAPREMEQRIVTVSERSFTTTVNDIQHIESQTIAGTSVIRIYFQPHAKIEAAIAQITAISQTILRILPPGETPPFIVQYNASSVPVLQASLSSKTLGEDQLTDLGNQFIRTKLATVEGASVPGAFGGKPRNIMVDLDPRAMDAYNVSAADVSNAINAQNLTLPAGTAKMGDREYNIRLNSSPDTVALLNDLPIKQVNGAMVYIRDVAQVRDGAAVQINMVRKDGRRAALLTVLKSGSASTLDVVQRVRAAMPKIQATITRELNVDFLFDQSLFVRASINGVLREAIIAAALTAAMILLFLGSWRSTFIVVLSIPLSIVVSILCLAALGQTLNVMTLGGLALAVGILVDDATVEIENIHRNLAMGKEIQQAILDGAQQIALPAFVSTLAICIVFVPVVFLSGTAKSLFTPLAMAVVFAMLASYLLTRTLVPTLVKYLVAGEVHLYQKEHGASGDGSSDKRTNADECDGESESRPKSGNRKKPRGNIIWRFSQRFEHYFEKMRERYRGALNLALDHPLVVTIIFVVFCGASFALYPFLGRDFFPTVDAGQLRLHVRAPPGTRLEETEQVFNNVEDVIRQTIPPDELNVVLDNIGLPTGASLAFSDNSSISTADGEILVSLKEEHKPTALYQEQLRARLKQQFPDVTCFFLPADIVSQILNFGIPAPIDIQVVGRDPKNYDIARQIQQRIAKIPGTVDAHVHQVVDGLELRVDVDRTKAEQIGLTQRDVATDLLISLSASGQTAPNFWINPQNGVSYQIQVQTPQYKIDSMQALQNTPITSSNSRTPQLLSNLATFGRGTSEVVVNHYDVQPTYDVYANVFNRDLGGVAGDIDKIVEDVSQNLPRGTTIDVRGQVETMRDSFVGLALGLIFAAVLVYLLIVINFQSWLDPAIILLALPGALSGILWILFATHTTLSVPALMGAIMTVGVATANSILLITFASEQRQEGKSSRAAALEAGYTRLRPVIMTAAAMIIGMLPMALGIGEGAEQNAPLGRAVIGGLLVATISTLFFVPVVYSVFERKHGPEHDMKNGIDGRQLQES
jgi:multidrug efflux pump subunit AcrB